MLSLSDLTEQVRTVLIATEDKKPRHEMYNQFINECKMIDLSEDDFYRQVLKPAHKSIDWDDIEQKKKETELSKIKTAAEDIIKQEQKEAALKQINHSLQYCINAGVVEPKELRSVFYKAETVGIDTNLLAQQIQTKFAENNFAPSPKPDITLPTLREILSSATWYNEAYLSRQPSPAAPPAKTKSSSSGAIILIIILLALIAGLYWFSQNKSHDSDYAAATTDTDHTMPVRDTSAITRKRKKLTHEETLSPADTTSSMQEDTVSDLTEVEKESVTSLLAGFYDYENAGDIPQLLNYFSYPVKKYYLPEYSNLSYDRLKNIYETSFHETMSYHHITIYNMSVHKNADGYQVTVSANYRFSTEKTPDGNRDIQLMVNLGIDKRITSIYEL